MILIDAIKYFSKLLGIIFLVIILACGCLYISGVIHELLHVHDYGDDAQAICWDLKPNDDVFMYVDIGSTEEKLNAKFEGRHYSIYFVSGVVFMALVAFSFHIFINLVGRYERH